MSPLKDYDMNPLLNGKIGMATPGSSPAMFSKELRTTSEPDTASLPDEDTEGDGTSSTADSGPSAGAARKYHRHVSRSAAKRESVSSLPSITSLRLHFASGGKAEHRAGHGAGIRSIGDLGATPEDEKDPDRGMKRLGLGRPQRKPWKEVQLARVSPAQARAEATQLSADVRKRWGLGRGGSAPSTAALSPETSVEVRSVFVDTARAVRRVRTLTLSLIPPGSGSRRVSGQSKAAKSFSTPSHTAIPTRSASGGVQTIQAGSPAPDASAPVRRAALDLLTSLRTLEERLRVKHDAPSVVVIDESLVASPVEVASGASLDRPTSASPTPDLRRLSLSSNRPSTSSLDDSLFSDDEDWNINDVARQADALVRPYEAWEDRLIAEDRAYRISEDAQWSAECVAVRDAARRWAAAVERMFGEQLNGPTVAWTYSGGTDMERVRSFFMAHLTAEQAALLPASDDGLLSRLSDGYLLVQAFNALVDSSSRPWGFIHDEDVHDTLGAAATAAAAAEMESGDATVIVREWTFRRVGNLTCWAAAIRLRYNLHIVLPVAAVLAPPTLPDGKPIPRTVSTSSPRKRDGPRIDFDPLVVAKRTEGEWEEMLSGLLVTWVKEAAKERQSEAALSEESEEVEAQ